MQAVLAERRRTSWASVSNWLCKGMKKRTMVEQVQREDSLVEKLKHERLWAVVSLGTGVFARLRTLVSVRY